MTRPSTSVRHRARLLSTRTPIDTDTHSFPQKARLVRGWNPDRGCRQRPLPDRLVVQHHFAILEGLDREELQGLLFEHRTPVMVPVSEDDRPYCDSVVISKAALDELGDEREACVHDDILSLFSFQASDDSREASFHDPNVLPFCFLEVMREDDLLSTLQETRELEHVLWI